MAKRALELLFLRETSEFVLSIQTSKFTNSVELLVKKLLDRIWKVLTILGLFVKNQAVGLNRSSERKLSQYNVHFDRRTIIEIGLWDNFAAFVKKGNDSNHIYF